MRPSTSDNASIYFQGFDVAKTRVVFVRHLPTQWNLEGRLQGTQDIDVATEAPETRAIADNVRDALRARSFDSVWTSELRRTKQTATLLGYASPYVSAELNELDFGPWEGRLTQDLRAERSGVWFTDPYQLEFGESFECFVARVRAFANHLSTDGYASALIIGHGAWIRCCIALADHDDARRMNQVTLGNGELVERDLEMAARRVVS